MGNCTGMAILLKWGILLEWQNYWNGNFTKMWNLTGMANLLEWQFY